MKVQKRLQGLKWFRLYFNFFFFNLYMYSFKFTFLTFYNKKRDIFTWTSNSIQEQFNSFTDHIPACLHVEFSNL